MRDLTYVLHSRQMVFSPFTLKIVSDLRVAIKVNNDYKPSLRQFGPTGYSPPM
jgi:hypothetical protein